MSTTRRTFLKTGAMLSLGPMLTTSRVFGMIPDKSQEGSLPSIGVCTSIKNAELLRQAGASYIEANVRNFLIPDKDDITFFEHLEAAGTCSLPILAANCFLPGSLKSVGPQANHEGVLAYADTAFKRAKKVGIQTIVFGSSGSRSIPKGFAHDKAELQFAALLGKMAPLAKASGVTVALEPLNKGEVNFINTLNQGARIVEPVDHPHIRLLADIFHMLRMEEGPEEILRFGHLLHHVHLAEKKNRTPPGVEGDDFKPYFRALKDVGYKGLISIECGWSDMAKELPKAIETLKHQMANV